MTDLTDDQKKLKEFTKRKLEDKGVISNDDIQQTDQTMNTNNSVFLPGITNAGAGSTVGLDVSNTQKIRKISEGYLPGINYAGTNTTSNIQLPGINQNKEEYNKNLDEEYKRVRAENIQLEFLDKKEQAEKYDSKITGQYRPVLKTYVNTVLDNYKKRGMRSVADSGVIQNTVKDELEKQGIKVSDQMMNSMDRLSQDLVLNYNDKVNEAFKRLEEKNLDMEIKEYYDNQNISDLLVHGDIKGAWYKMEKGMAENWNMIPEIVLMMIQPEMGLAVMGADVYVQENQGAFEDMIDNGATYTEARDGAVLVGIVNSAVELFMETVLGGVKWVGATGFRRFFMKNAQKQVVKRMTKKGTAQIITRAIGAWLKGSAVEGLEEIVQQIVGNAMVQTVNEARDLYEGLRDSFEGAFFNPLNIIGGAGNIMKDKADNKKIDVITDIEALNYVDKKKLKERFMNNGKGTEQQTETNTEVMTEDITTNDQNTTEETIENDMIDEVTRDNGEKYQIASIGDIVNENNTPSIYKNEENEKLMDEYNKKLDEIKSELDNLSNETFMDKIQNSIKSDEKSNYITYRKNNATKSLRISTVSNWTGGKNVVVKIVENKNSKGKKSNKANVTEFVYDPDNLTMEQRQGILDGLQNFSKTGVFNDVNYTSKNKSTRSVGDSKYQLKYEEKGYNPGVAGKNEKTISGKEGVNVRNKITKETIRQLAEKYGVRIEVIEGMIKVLENGVWDGKSFAYGKYVNNLLTLSEQIKESTAPHELLHAIFDMIDPETKTYLISQVMKSEGWSAEKAEERLADSFSNFFRTGKIEGAPKSTWGKIKIFFKKVRSFINGMGRWRSELEDIFTNIITSEGIGELQGRIDKDQKLQEGKAKMKQRFLEYAKRAERIQKQAEKNGEKYQIGYHGSQAGFDKFDSSHMGEGEGNQVHGWGHYVTLDPKRGMYYAEMKDSLYTYKKMKGLSWMEKQLVNDMLNDLADDRVGTPKEAIEGMIKGYEMQIQGLPEDSNYRKNTQERIDFLKSLDVKDFEYKGGERHLYEVEIPDPVKADTPTGKNYLDEEEVLSNEAIQEIIDELSKKRTKGAERAKNYIEDEVGSRKDISGNDMIDMLRIGLGDKKASKFLESIGYKGISYNGARDGKGYVIFNDDDLEIVRHEKYQKAGDINSEAFKKRFGDSKVVDKDGNPLVVYHGTPYGGFTVFKNTNRGSIGDEGYFGMGWYFTNNKDLARDYSDEAFIDPEERTNEPGAYGNVEIKEVYLKIDNPFIISEKDVEYEYGALEKLLSTKNPSKSTEKLKDEGYDGVIYEFNSGTKEYTVFYPNQIKSATDNIGTYDPNNPDIRYQRVEDPIQEFRKNTAKYYPNYKAIEKGARSVIERILRDAGVDAEIVDLVFTGSKSRGLEHDTSDYDILVELKGDNLREDDLYNLLNDEDLNGGEYDFNPIIADKSGTIREVVQDQEKYMSNKRKIKDALENEGVVWDKDTADDAGWIGRKDAETFIELLKNEGNLELVKNGSNAINRLIKKVNKARKDNGEKYQKTEENKKQDASNNKYSNQQEAERGSKKRPVRDIITITEEIAREVNENINNLRDYIKNNDNVTPEEFMQKLKSAFLVRGKSVYIVDNDFGDPYTLRLSNHQANLEYSKTFGHPKNNTSIVINIEPKKFKTMDDVDMKEYFYIKDNVNKNVMLGIIKGVEDWLKTGEYTDKNYNKYFQSPDNTIGDIYSNYFKKRFGDWENDPENASKIVKKDGTPRIVYHGTKADFNVFKNRELGFHFGSTKAQAKVKAGNKGKIMQAYLNIRNPIDVYRDMGNWTANYTFGDRLKEKGIITEDERKSFKYKEDRLSDRILIDILEKKGYDGVIYDNWWEGASEAKSYIAFRPEQIKSATDNIGTYDPNNPDIRYQKADSDNRMVALHNLTYEKLAKAKDLGGLIAPSVAITKSGIPFENYGEITFIANKGLVNPSEDVVVGETDLYTPRVPKPTLEWKDGVTREQEEKIAEKLGMRWVELNDYIYNGGDTYYERSYPNLAKEVEPLIEKKLFKGFTDMGDRIYEEYNISNILKEMFSEGDVGAESAIFQGTLSEAMARMSDGVKDLENVRGKINTREGLDKEYDALSDKYTDLGWDILGGREGMSIFSENIKKSNSEIVEELADYDIEVTEKQVQQLKNIVKKALKLPKSYVEAKIKRGVGFNEFTAVVVPEDKVKDVQALIGNEIDVYGYKPGERMDVIEAVANDKGAKFQRVYHGSPASFDRFDSSHMGEGEGAQAHGWGHYVAVEERTGRHYADMGGDPSMGYKGESWNNLLIKGNDPEYYIPRIVIARMDEGMSFAEARNWKKRNIEHDIENIENSVDKKLRTRELEELKKQLEILNSLKADDFQKENNRHLYEVEIPDPVKADTPTGWNYIEEKPHNSDPNFKNAFITDEQIIEFANLLKRYNKDAGRKFLNRMGTLYANKSILGEDLYKELSSALGSQEEASKFLESLGYDGIHYFGGRDGEAYVIFNDDDLEIKNHEKYQKAEYEYDENGKIKRLKFGEDNGGFNPAMFDWSDKDLIDMDKKDKVNEAFYDEWMKYNNQNYEDDQLTYDEFVQRVIERSEKEQDIYDQKMKELSDAQNDPYLLELQLRAVNLMEEEGKVGKKFGKNVSKEVRDKQQAEVERKREKLVEDIKKYMYPGLTTEELTYDDDKRAMEQEAEWEMLGKEAIEDKLKYFRKDKNGFWETKNIKLEDPTARWNNMVKKGDFSEIIPEVDRVIEWRTPQGQHGILDRAKDPKKYKSVMEKINKGITKTKVTLKDVTKDYRTLEQIKAKEQAEKERIKKEQQEARAEAKKKEYQKQVRMSAFQRLIDMQRLERYPFLTEEEIRQRYGFTEEEWRKITEQEELRFPLKKRSDKAKSDFNKAVYEEVKVISEGLDWQNRMKQKEAENNLGEISDIDLDILLGKDEEKGQKEVDEFKRLAEEKQENKKLKIEDVKIDKERENNKSEKEKVDKIIKSTKTDKTVRGSVKEFGKNILQPASTQIREISKKIHWEVMKYFQNKEMLTNQRLKEVDPFLKAMKKMRKENPVRFMDVWVALANRNIGYANGLLQEYGVTVPTNLLDTIYDEAQDVGLNINYLGNYYPLSVKAPRAFLEELMKVNEGDIASEIEKRIMEESKRKGGPLEEAEVTAIINSVITGEEKGPDVNVGNAHLKKRNTEIKRTPKMLEYCDDPISTLISYIEGMTQSIERAKFLGKSRSGNVHTLADYVYNAKNGLTPEQQDKLIDLLKSVFNDAVPRKAIQAWRDIATLTTLGSPSSTLTQLGDLSFSVYENGWRETLKAVWDIWMKRKAFNLKDMGVLNRGEEYTNINSMKNLLQKAIHNVFKLTFFSQFDTFGKSAYIQSTWKKRQKRAKQGEKGDKQLRKDIMKWTDDEYMTDKIINDLKNGIFSEDVALMMYVKLSNIQPLTKAQMPQAYLNNPNGRLFYQFKTFGIKQLDYVLQETREQTKNFKSLSTSEKLLKIAQIANMVLIMTLLGMGADELKDVTMRRRSNSLILRRLFGDGVGTEQIWDKMEDNVLKLLGLSRYTLMQMKNDPVDAITSLFTTLPATNIINYPFKDIYKAFKNDGSIDRKSPASYQLIPVVGKYRYWIYGGGQDKQQEALGKKKKNKKSGGSLKSKV